MVVHRNNQLDLLAKALGCRYQDNYCMLMQMHNHNRHKPMPLFLESLESHLKIYNDIQAQVSV
jgi:hypothetical protein